MAKKNKIVSGVRVAYSATFLRSQGMFYGAAPMRRGTVASVDGAYARVKWDDADYAYLADRYGEDFVEDAKANGQLVSLNVLAAVGSAAMSAN